jgi:hypothetical protein
MDFSRINQIISAVLSVANNFPEKSEASIQRSQKDLKNPVGTGKSAWF